MRDNLPRLRYFATSAFKVIFPPVTGVYKGFALKEACQVVIGFKYKSLPLRLLKS